MKTQRLRHLALALVTVIGADAVSALAHSFPQAQTPSAGQTLPASPNDVTIQYDAPIEKLFATLQVLDAEGKNEATGDPELGSDGRTLSVRVGALRPGDYTVRWSVVCIDTHRTQGTYQFTVAGGGP